MIGSQLSTKLHTASTLTVNDDVISSINKCIISEEKEKQVINLCDDDDDDETKEDRVKEVPVWITNARSRLTIKEKTSWKMESN